MVHHLESTYRLEYDWDFLPPPVFFIFSPHGEETILITLFSFVYSKVTDDIRLFQRLIYEMPYPLFY